MYARILIPILTFAILPTFADDDRPEDRKLIKAAALDYIEGWYDGDAKRMEKAVHTELAKRAALPDPRSKRLKIEQMSAMTLVQMTARKAKMKTPEDQRHTAVKILDLYENVAIVRAEMQDWIDFMQMSKIGGEWKIVNVLWEPTPDAKKRWGFPADD